MILDHHMNTPDTHPTMVILDEDHLIDTREIHKPAVHPTFTDLFADLVAQFGEQNHDGGEDFFVHSESRIGCRYADLSMHLRDDGWHYGQLPEAYPTPAECYAHWREDEARFFAQQGI